MPELLSFLGGEEGSNKTIKVFNDSDSLSENQNG